MSMTSPVHLGLIMGSGHDWERGVSHAATALNNAGISHEKHVFSAARTPDRAIAYATNAYERRLRLIIAGAGLGGHIAPLTASATIVPVIGIPLVVSEFEGIDSVCGMMQGPDGKPVGVVGIGKGDLATTFAIHCLSLQEHRAPNIGILLQDSIQKSQAVGLLSSLDISSTDYSSPDSAITGMNTGTTHALVTDVTDRDFLEKYSSQPVVIIPQITQKHSPLIALKEHMDAVGDFPVVSVTNKSSINAAIFIAQILAMTDETLAEKIIALRRIEYERILKQDAAIQIMHSS